MEPQPVMASVRSARTGVSVKNVKKWPLKENIAVLFLVAP